MFRNLFSSQSDTPEGFWKWFLANEARIWAIDQNPQKVTRMIQEAIDQFCPGLEIEIAMSVRDGRRQLFISDGGRSENASKAEALYRAAPAMSLWQVIQHGSTPLTQPPVQSTPDEAPTTDEGIRFQFFNDGERVGILLMFPNYVEAKRDTLAHVAPGLIKDALGEQAYTNRVGFVDFAGADSNFYPNARPLSVLRNAFDEYFRFYK